MWLDMGIIMVCVPLASVVYADEVAKDGYLGDYGCGYVEFTNAPKVSPRERNDRTG